MRLRILSFLISTLTVLIALMPAIPARAESPIDLVLGGSGAAPWVLGNLKPGDAGSIGMTVRNAGRVAGFINIWASNIVDTGSLSQHLRLGIAANRLSTNIRLPAKLVDLPGSAADFKVLTISPVQPGETIDLIWQWQLPPETGNEIQSDRVTFNISYTLQEMPATGGGGASDSSGSLGGGPLLLPVISKEQETGLQVTRDGTVVATQTILTGQAGVSMTVERGTRIINAAGEMPTWIEITRTENMTLPLPAGLVYASPIYDVSAYSARGKEKVTFSQPVRLLLPYDTKVLTENTLARFMAYFDEESQSWVQLPPIEGLIAEADQMGCLVSHLSYFAVLAIVQAQTSAAEVIAPARFIVTGLEITPREVAPGDTVTVRVLVENRGGISGETTLILKLNGLFLDSQTVRLAPGQNRSVSFIVKTFREGTFAIEIGGNDGSFVVTGADVISGRGISRGLLIALLTGSLIVLVFGFTFMLTRRR